MTDNVQKGMMLMAKAMQLMQTPTQAQPQQVVAPQQQQVVAQPQPTQPQQVVPGVPPLTPVASQPGAVPPTVPAAPAMPMMAAQPMALTMDQIAQMSPADINTHWDHVKAVLDAAPANGSMQK